MDSRRYILPAISGVATWQNRSHIQNASAFGCAQARARACTHAIAIAHWRWRRNGLLLTPARRVPQCAAVNSRERSFSGLAPSFVTATLATRPAAVSRDTSWARFRRWTWNLTQKHSNRWTATNDGQCSRAVGKGILQTCNWRFGNRTACHTAC